MRKVLFAAILCLQGLAAHAQGTPTIYHGACDGSAAVALDANHFVAANDDENALRIYRIGVSNPIVPPFDLNDVLKPEKKQNGQLKEVDIEGGARVGDRLYWIGSHARDSKGKKESSRHRFFATDIAKGTGVVPFTLTAIARDFDLQKEMIEQLPGLKLKDAAQVAPEDEGGFNIEGLAAAPDGGLMIGLRNPLPGDLAIVIPFTNPAEVLTGDTPKFGTPERLDLGKRGIRSIERIGDRYVIVAGPFNNKGTFALYTWSGPGGQPPRQETTVVLGDLRPEALFATADPKEVYLLSDDGSDACKGLTDQNQKTFRGLAVRLSN